MHECFKNWNDSAQSKLYIIYNNSTTLLSQINRLIIRYEYYDESIKTLWNTTQIITQLKSQDVYTDEFKSLQNTQDIL